MGLLNTKFALLPMAKRSVCAAALFLSVCGLSAHVAAQAGKNSSKPKEPRGGRWQISWGVDPDANNIPKIPKTTTPAELVKLKRPTVLGKGKTPEAYRAKRIAPVETTIWSIKGTLVEVASERDGDYRLTVADKAGHQVCCVLPDPALAPRTGVFSKQIDTARAFVLKHFKPTFAERKVNVPIELAGLGYFGRHGDENPSPEGFQLHPVIQIRILKK